VRRRIRLLIGLPLLIVGVLIGLFGLVAILYNGDCRGGDCSKATVELLGGEMDANTVGVIVLAIGLVVIWLAARILKRRRNAKFAKPS
jgi:hypothetical protein